MINSATISDAKLHKRHNILSFHFVRSMIACGYINLQHLKLECNRQVPAYSDFVFEHVAEVRDTPRQGKLFSKILRIEMENYSHHHDNGNVLNSTSMDIDLFNINLFDKMAGSRSN
jgi:hypothetical protein